MKSIISIAALAATALGATAQNAIGITADSPTITENFDSMGEGLDLPAAWRVQVCSEGPRIVGDYATALTATHFAGGPNLASNQKNGTYNFYATANPADRAVGGISTNASSGNNTRGTNVYTVLVNDDTQAISSLSITFDVEKYRKGTNAAGFTAQLYYSTDGTTWVSAGDGLKVNYDSDNATEGSDIVPIDTKSVSAARLSVNVAPGELIYLAWNISSSTGTDCAAAQALAIDNVEITADYTYVDPLASVIAVTSDDATVSENFDSMGERLDLPQGWRVQACSEGPRIVGNFASALTATHFTGGPNLASNQKNGTYNFYATENTSDRAIGGISTNANSGNNTRGTNIYVALYNADSQSISSLSMSYDIEKYRKGSNAAGFSVQMYYSIDGITWTAAGDDFKVSFDPDDANGGADIVPIASASIDDARLSVMVASGQCLYLAWNIAATTGTDCASAMALAIDNVTISLDYGTVDMVKTVTTTPADVVLVPSVPQTVKLVSMNNSLIQRNEQWTIWNRLAAAMNKDANWTNHTMLGQTLATHYNSDDARPLIESEEWTHIILQEQSALPRTDYASFRDNVKMWVDYVRDHCPNPNAVILLPANWGYNENGFADFTNQNTQLMQSYSRIAQELGVTITPVALAYQLIYDDMGADYLATLYTDNRHPAPNATYLAACMEYGIIYGEDPLTISYEPRNLTTEECLRMRQYASRALKEYTNVVDHHARTVRYESVVTDQYMNVVRSDTPFSYSASGGGTCEAGVFTANGKVGEYTISVCRDEDECGSVCVRVAAPPFCSGIQHAGTSDSTRLMYSIDGRRVTHAARSGIYVRDKRRLVIK